MTRHLVSCALAVAAALTVAACNSDSSASPTSPSASGARGAVIAGRVTGVASTSTVSSATSADISGPMAVSRVTVTIVGTSISTVTDGDGRFTLTGVPPGDVQLKFTGSGIDGTLTLSGIAPDQRITITVALNGRGARLESERREDDDDDDDEAKLEGGISGLTGACPNLTFTLRQTTVRTNSTTKFEDGPCSRVANNARLKVEGRRQPDGSILAKEVELEDAGDDDDEDDEDDDDNDETKLEGGVSSLSGVCPNLTFTVRQTTVRTNSATKFEDGPCSRVANNRRVKVEGRRQSDGSILAKEVELDD